MDANQFREAAHAAIEQVISYFQDLPNMRVSAGISPGWLAPLLPSEAPSKSEPFTAIADDITTKIMPGLTHWQHPRFMAWFPAHTTFPSILGEIYSAAFNAPAFNWLCSPATTELETLVLDWMVQLLGLPKTWLSSTGVGGGVIQGSASEAMVAVMIAARERAVQRVLDAEGLTERPDESPEDQLRREDRAAEVRGKLVALGNEQAHSSSQKAANLCGVRYRAVPAPATTGFRMMGDAVREKLNEVRAAGLVPFFLTTMLGTTGSCAVDPIDEVVAACEEVCGEQQVWVHVDAAYAGSALCCEEFRWASRGLDKVDSFDMNMHKWMLVNFDASCLYLRDRKPLITAMSISPSYLVNPSTISGLVTDYRDWQIPLGRRFRALKIWFVLRTYGAERIRAMIRRHVALSEFFADLVRKHPTTFEVLTGPAFALTVIRCVIEGGKEDECNALTKQVCELVNSRGELLVTGAQLGSMYGIRVVTATEHANEEDVRKGFEILRLATEEVRAAQA